jgi:hypothetical protein
VVLPSRVTICSIVRARPRAVPGGTAESARDHVERHSAQLSESRGSVICRGFPNRIRRGAGALLGVRTAGAPRHGGVGLRLDVGRSVPVDAAAAWLRHRNFCRASGPIGRRRIEGRQRSFGRCSRDATAGAKCGNHKADDEHVAVAENILSIRVVNAAERRRLYIGAEWKSFDPAARHYTQAEIDAEHRSYNAGS